MSNEEILKALIKARKDYNRARYPGMCHHLARTLSINTYSLIVEIIPEFNRKFLVSSEIPTLRQRSVYWWDTNDYQSRVEAFDKLIDIYQ